MIRKFPDLNSLNLSINMTLRDEIIVFRPPLLISLTSCLYPARPAYIPHDRGVILLPNSNRYNILRGEGRRELGSKEIHARYV